MPPSADLHTHTTFSDGRASPEELVREAAAMGLQTLAITDHDVLDGSAAAQGAAAALGIELISGVEITTVWEGVDDEVDVLAYHIDLEDANLRAALRSSIGRLYERVEALCGRLRAMGYPVTFAEAEAHNPRYVGYSSVIEVMRAKGQVANFLSGRDVLWAARQQVARPFGMPIQEALALIRSAGGVAVLAHPSAIRERRWPTAEEIRPLVEAGLGGIEVYHPAVDAPARDYFRGLARQFDLAVTGGSDEHGYPAGFPLLGREPVTQEMVEALRLRAKTDR